MNRIRMWVFSVFLFSMGWGLNSLVTYELDLRHKAKACDIIGCLDLVSTEEVIKKTDLNKKIEPIILQGEE